MEIAGWADANEPFANGLVSSGLSGTIDIVSADGETVLLAKGFSKAELSRLIAAAVVACDGTVNGTVDLQAVAAEIKQMADKTYAAELNLPSGLRRD